jgi:KAP family P-loop domain
MEERKSKYKFQKLTPESAVDLNLYEDAIDYIFDSPDVRNVAISGAYGSGKSSLIASYRKKHNNLRFVHISLAHFKHSDSDKENETEIKESLLEGKIINQLIHQIPSENIPQTNFKVKKKIKGKNILCNTLFTMLFIISILHITKFESWNGYVASLSTSWIKNFLEIFANKNMLLISGLLVAITLSIFLYSLIKAQKTKNIFKRVRLQGNEIEIFEDSEESYFDKYLNEVLYLFENIEADVIVFEDMDRFDANRVFERLREVNTLANIQLEKENKNPLRFFYLLRDDIYVSKDRTKFFDYIVPVVPVVDSSNSYDQFITHFIEGGIYELFDENFLQGLSLYIDDMRILKNIYNEFVIYYNRLNTIELDSNKMLAIITYKNLFPRDFSELQLNQGMVYTLFAKKDDFIKTEIERLEELAANKKDEIEFARKEHLTSIQELDDVYNAKRSRIPNAWNYNQQRQELEKEYNEEYPYRKEAIENKLKSHLPYLEDELSRLEQEIILTKSKQLNEIITRENIDFIFKVTTTNEIGVETNFHEIKASEYFALLKYLIRNGFIDETYSDYMTYFYETSLSRVDKTFLRSITDKKAKEYTYQLKNPARVTDRLRLVDFDQEEILNFDLFQHLLQTNTNLTFLNRFLQQLRDNRNYKFIGEYFDTERELSSYVKFLNRQWPEMFSSALEARTMSDKNLRLYSIYSLYYSEDEALQAINIKNCLTCYISNSSDYLNIDEPNIDKLLYGFIQLNVSFVSINTANPDLLEEVYRNSLYVINFENLRLMLKEFYQVKDENDIYQRNYTLVLTEPESPLTKYVNDNMGTYIDVVLSYSTGEINDDEKVSLLILNNEAISSDQKNSYMKLLKTSITSIIEVIDRNLWASLLNNHLVKYSEENIMEYFGDDVSLSTTLISFINSGESTLNFFKAKNSYGSEKAEKFFDASIVANKLSNNKYREILTSLNFTYDIFDVEGISDEKVRIVIDERMVPMNLENLLFIRESYSSQVFYFIEKNINDYSKAITSEAFVLDEVIEILSWDVADDIKTRLLEFANVPVSVINKGYSAIVNAYILKNNLDTEDVSHLFATYEDWNEIIQKIINDLAVNRTDIIINEPMNVSRKLVTTLLASNDLDYKIKIDIFISSLPSLGGNECNEYLDILDLGEYKKIFEERSRPRYKINTVNGKLLAAFKESNWISDFYEVQNKEGYYKIIRNRRKPKSSR